MEKNDVLKSVIDSLMKQRTDMNYELATLNHNEINFNDRKITLECAVINIDNQVNNMIMNLENE